MSELRGHVKIKMGSERGFGLVISAAFWIVAFWPIMSGGNTRIWAVAIAGVFLVLAIAVPRVLAPLNKLWFKFGLLLGAIVNPIVMSLLFLLAILPTGIIMRILGKDLLRQKLNKSADSYWIKREGPMGSMKNQF